MKPFCAALIVLVLGSLLSLALPTSVSEGHDVSAVNAMAKLSPGVQAYLKTLNAGDYEIYEPSEMDPQGRAVVKDHGVIYNCDKGQVAITYDDGPFSFHRQISQKWKNAGHQLTFFLNGNNYNCTFNEPYPTWIRESLRAGHLLASHTWTHPNLTTLTNKEIDEQIDLMETLYLKIAGVVPRYFRCPYGQYNAAVIERLQTVHGLTVVQWSDNVGDAEDVPLKKQKAVYRGIYKGETHLILNHEPYNTSAGEVADLAIARFKAQGIVSKTVHDCIGRIDSPYKVRAKPAMRDTTWTCDGTPQPGPF